MIDALLHALATSHLPLTDEEFADVLWLASYMDMPSNASTLANSPEVQPQPTTPADAQNRHQQPTKEQQAANTSGQPTASAQAEVHLPKPSTHDKQRVEGMRAVSFRSPAATALPGKLALARALRPILRKVPSSTQQELDEVATAEQAAEEGRIVPRLRPGRERWLDVAVVIDDWHTMAIWQQTIAEFVELLQQLGAFRTLQTYLLSTRSDEQTEQATLQLFTAQGFKRGRICPPGELVDPRGRRLTLVLTDCTSPAWSSGAAGQLLSQWGNSNIVTLVQMLPPDLWNSCALADAIQIAVSAPAPGIHNAKLAVEHPWYWDDIWDGNRTPAMLSQPVPIITLEPEPLRRWIQVMTGKGGSKATAFYLLLQPAHSSNQKMQALSESLSPEERWRRFRATASPMAQELVGYLSAAPLSLSVMRLVQRVMLPQSRQVHLAEILQSGLIQQLTPWDIAIDPSEIRYDFVADTRKLLLTTVLLSDTKKVVERVSEYVSNHSDQMRKLHTLILDPTSPGEFTLDDNSIPLARVATVVLRRFGGSYALLAERLDKQFATISDKSRLPTDAQRDDQEWVKTIEEHSHAVEKPALNHTRESESNTVFEHFVRKVNQVLTVQVHMIDTQTGSITLLLENDQKVLLARGEQIPTEKLNRGDFVKVYVVDVHLSRRGPVIKLSRTHRNLLRRLMEMIIPEIKEGIIEIKSIAREPGQRSKVAVATTHLNVDPVGSCVGKKGARIQSIADELSGEKIDIIAWSNDAATYISNALSPAKSSYTLLDEKDKKTAVVVVPDRQLSLAIGKNGQNVRLAAKLTGWRIDIKKESEAANEGLDKQLAERSQQIKVGDLLSRAEQLLKEEPVDNSSILSQATKPNKLGDLVDLQGDDDKATGKTTK